MSPDIGWRTQLQRSRPPDIYFQWDGFKVDMAAARGWALDLRPHLSPEFRDAFVPAALAPPALRTARAATVAKAAVDFVPEKARPLSVAIAGGGGIMILEELEAAKGWERGVQQLD